MFHVKGGIDIPFILALIGTAKQSKLFVIEHEPGLNGMGVILFHQVDQLCADISDCRTLISHVPDSHIRGHGDFFILILQDMVVAVQLPRDFGQVGNHRGYFAKIQAVYAQGEVLKHGGVLVLSIELDTCFIIGYQVYLGLHFPVTTQEDKVVFVKVELLVTYRGAFRQEAQAHAILLHLGSGSEAHTHLTFRIVIAQTRQCTVFVDMAVDEGVEHELRIFLVVADLSLITETLTFLCQVQAYGVYAGRIVDE